MTCEQASAAASRLEWVKLWVRVMIRVFIKASVRVRFRAGAIGALLPHLRGCP